MDQAARGSASLDSKDFPAAIKHYTDAISEKPQAVDYYIKRSVAHTRISPPDHAAALQDAEIALVLAKKRATRELIAQAQLRRGIALFGLQRWSDAKECFKWVEKLNEKEKSLGIWHAKLEGKLKDLNEDDEMGKVHISEYPDVELPKEPAKEKPKPKAESAPKVELSPSANGATKAAEASRQLKPGGVQTPASKIRHDWYQTAETVTVTLLAKGVPKDKASIEIQMQALAISFPLPTGSDFQFSLDPLFAKIDPSASTSKVMSTKVEFILKKAISGQKWASLEGDEIPEPAAEPTTVTDAASSEAVTRTVLSGKPYSAGPAYPTSSKSGPKDWDKVAADLSKKPTKADGEEDGGDDDMDDFEGSDPTNSFFQKIYKDASPETRRAMVKSMQESNGTHLSTNWDEVSKGPVETSPPDGIEAKRW